MAVVAAAAIAVAVVVRSEATSLVAEGRSTPITASGVAVIVADEVSYAREAIVEESDIDSVLETQVGRYEVRKGKGARIDA